MAVFVFVLTENILKWRHHNHVIFLHQKYKLTRDSVDRRTFDAFSFRGFLRGRIRSEPLQVPTGDYLWRSVYRSSFSSMYPPQEVTKR